MKRKKISSKVFEKKLINDSQFPLSHWTKFIYQIDSLLVSSPRFRSIILYLYFTSALSLSLPLFSTSSHFHRSYCHRIRFENNRSHYFHHIKHKTHCSSYYFTIENWERARERDRMRLEYAFSYLKEKHRTRVENTVRIGRVLHFDSFAFFVYCTSHRKWPRVSVCVCVWAVKRQMIAFALQIRWS